MIVCSSVPKLWNISLGTSPFAKGLVPRLMECSPKLGYTALLEGRNLIDNPVMLININFGFAQYDNLRHV